MLFGLILSLVLLEVGLRIGGFLYLTLQEYRNIISVLKRGSFRIMCLGESTTAIGGKDSYPSQLEKILNQRSKKVQFSVFNKAIPGVTTNTLVAQLQKNLKQYNPDMVIVMMGCSAMVLRRAE